MKTKKPVIFDTTDEKLYALSPWKGDNDGKYTEVPLTPSAGAAVQSVTVELDNDEIIDLTNTIELVPEPAAGKIYSVLGALITIEVETAYTSIDGDTQFAIGTSYQAILTGSGNAQTALENEGGTSYVSMFGGITVVSFAPSKNITFSINNSVAITGGGSGNSMKIRVFYVESDL